MKREQRGITLVALIVTIIILLILAGISISTLTNTGLFEKAREAEQKSKNAQEEEEATLSQYEDLMEQYLSGKGGNTKPQETEKTPLENAQSAKPANSTITETDASKGIVMVDSNENEWVWVEVPKSIYTNPTYTSANSNNNVTSATDYDGIYKILEAYAKTYRGSYTDEWYAKDGSTVVTASTSGLTEEQKQLNNGCGLTYNEYKEKYEKMLSSVFTNGGFWISRYEIGDSTATTNNSTRYYTTAQVTANENIAGIAVSKQNQIPYNFVTCSQAQTLANVMTTDAKTSSLLFGIQWDLTCKFLEEKADWGTTVQKEKIAYIKTDSSDWGNYFGKLLTLNRGKYNTSPNSSGSVWTLYTEPTQDYVTDNQKLAGKGVLLTTGASDTAKKMNIYDLAGNEFEWTLEHATSRTDRPCAGRGGIYYDSGSSYPASNRSIVSTSSANYHISFRVTLY